MVNLHREGRISVGITGVSAAENLAGSRKFPGSAIQFRRRLSALGWDDLEVVLAPCVISLSFIGWTKIVDDNFSEEIDALWQAVFPGIDRKLPKRIKEDELWSPQYSKWRNAWCDIHTIWAHISANRDIFVTLNTSDFQRHEKDLAKLSLKRVMTPDDALAVVTTS